MQLFVMRHGQATPFSESDANRKLTKNGFDEVEKMASWLNSAHGDIERILVSPYVRAQQTAQQIIKHPKIFAKPITVDFITPEGNAKQVHDYIDGLLTSATIESILIVSHMPLVSYLLAELTLESNAPIIQTAAIAHIDYDVTLMKGRLVSLISPSDI